MHAKLPSCRGHGAVRPGFTLIEILIVTSVIAILTGMGIAVAHVLRKNAQEQGTRQLIDTVALAMRQYGRETWWVPSADRNIRLWDWNHDRILDGDPTTETVTPSAPTAAQVVASGYRGVIALTTLDLPKNSIETPTLRVLDAYKKPLQIFFAASTYREDAWGICSIADAPGKGLNSWTR